jgi:hypothetical protein
MNVRYDSGDLIFYTASNNLGDSTGLLFSGMVVRHVTAAEIAGMPGATGLSVPAVWVSSFGSLNVPIVKYEVRPPGEAYTQNVIVVEQNAIIGVIKAAVDSDLIAGLLA